MNEDECDGCMQETRFEYLGAGLRFCISCGLGQQGHFEEFDQWSCNEQMNRTCYTRLKRFRKYLGRACHMQNTSSVPDETWQYLVDHGPYSNTKQIIRVLKVSKLKRKCYDSLPLMVSSLCKGAAVPTLDAMEFRQALEYFSKIDSHYRKSPSFISYLYILEYILHKLGRKDMCTYLSRIQCQKRRLQYNGILDKIFGERCPVHAVLN